MKITNPEIKKRMIMIMESEDPPETATELAELTAWHFASEEWIDDETHPVWEIALEFFYGEE